MFDGHYEGKHNFFIFRSQFVIATVDRFHYLHFGAFSFLLVICVATVVSLITEPIPKVSIPAAYTKLTK